MNIFEVLFDYTVFFLSENLRMSLKVPYVSQSRFVSVPLGEEAFLL